MISDLPRDMVEEVLSKLPMTSLRRARFTCKRWNNTLSKNLSLTKKYRGEAAKRKEFQVVMMLDYHDGKLVNLDDSAHDGVDILEIFHCRGLLLCLTKDRTRFVVWNPFNGQTRWIHQPRDCYNRYDRYAFGYEKKNKYSRRSYKVLRFVDDYYMRRNRQVLEFDIFSLNSNSWKVVVVNPDWRIQYFYRGLSLKGDTYWFAEEKLAPEERTGIRFLLCFNFTTESFGPLLPLPFCGGPCGNKVSLSSVREEKIAVLLQESGAPSDTLKIWISSKVDPSGVSWNKLYLVVDMNPLTDFQFVDYSSSFFVDEKKKMVVFIDMNKGDRNMAYIIGDNGYFKTVDLGGLANRNFWPLVCSYVPSSVRINQKNNTTLI